MLMDLGGNNGRGVTGLVEAVLALLSGCHEVGAAGVQRGDALSLHFYLLEDTQVWSLGNLWEESRS
jgi:hypothetical protein